MCRTTGVPSFLIFTTILFYTMVPCAAAVDQNVTYPPVHSRLTLPIDETKLEPIKGQVHPLARAEFDRGVVDDNMPVEHLIILLKRSPAQEQAAALLIDELHNRNSPMYHRWLGAEEYGKRFGPPDDDLAKLTDWFQSKGFTLDDVPPGGTHITISGTAGMIREAFHTEIHSLFVNGEKQKAILTDPYVPAALAPMIAGFLHLHSWHAKPLHHDAVVVRRHNGSGMWEEAENRGSNPEITFPHSGSTVYAVTPQDWNTIYNANPLLQSGITGAGTTIAVLEETEVANKADVTSFRSQFGLPAYPATPSSTAGGINWMYGPGNGCTVPPVTSKAEEGEALLDVEWAGAVAPKAIVDFVACKSTASAIGSYGRDLAASYVANYLHSTVVAASLSYGDCELDAGSTGTAYYSTLFHQMAAAGITAVVASGDQGSMTCDVGAVSATHNLSSNAYASSPYTISAGGTDFSDTYQGAVNQYWNNNTVLPYGSALSYIPEMPWGGLCSSPFLPLFLQNTGNTAYGVTYTPEAICNNSSATTNGLVQVGGGSGGVSTYNTLPTWQSVYGIGLSGSNTSTAFRNQPDISFFASSYLYPWGHALLYCQSDVAACTYNTAGDAYALAAGGTSFVAPQIAGLMALVNQYTQSRQGVANYTLYALADLQFGVAGKPNSANLANCSGSMLGGMAGNDCIFRDIGPTPNPHGGTITGNTVQPCLYSGVTNCFRASASDPVGLSSVGTYPTTNNPAHAAGLGYDLATGLGSVNVYNLVANWNLDVSFASTTLLAAPNPASITSAQSTVLTATVTATGRGSVPPAAGTVSFYLTHSGVPGALLGTSALSQSCTGTAPNITCAAAKAALTVPGAVLNPGANSIVAQFPGDGANDAPSNSSAVTVTVSATAQNVTTLNPTSLTASRATLNGTVNPKGAAGYAYFDYGTSPTLAGPSSTSSQPVVVNSIAQTFSASLSLATGTTYYFRMVFHNTNAATSTYGAILHFATLSPVETTLAATAITSSGATLNGTVNPQGSPSYAFFQYGTSPTLATYGATAEEPVTVNMTVQPFAYPLSGLASGTTYYFRMVCRDPNNGTYSYGAIRSFATLPAVVTTLAATAITSSGATLNGTFDAQSSPGYVYFQYGTSSTLATYNSTPMEPVTLSMSTVAVSWPLGGLSSGPTYYFRLVFYDNNNGTYTYGAIRSFTTPPAVVVTLPATGISGDGATLNGTVNPQGSPGYAYFEWGTSSTLAAFNSTTSEPVTVNLSTQPVFWPLSLLSAGTTYYFRMVFFDNYNATYTYGAILSFQPFPPVATTRAATAMGSSGATLNGTVNPQGSPGYAYFQYGTSSTLATFNSTPRNPVTLNMTAQTFACVIGSLTSSTTYYFRMVFYDSSTGNFSYGAILSFKTTI